MPRRKQLVCQHLERVSRSLLEDYQDLVRDLVKGRQGVYALYRDQRLQYVGLTVDLRGRLKRHLRDRHGSSWNRFSVYLTIGVDHLKELESLVLRIVEPKGNKQKGRFTRSENLLPALRREMRDRQRKQVDRLFSRSSGESEGRRRKARPVTSQKGAVPLARYVSKPLPLRARFKGKVHRAHVRADGFIRLKGELYRSPSAAGRAIVNRANDGWSFWEYQRAPGDWVPLKELRR